MTISISPRGSRWSVATQWKPVIAAGIVACGSPMNNNPSAEVAIEIRVVPDTIVLGRGEFTTATFQLQISNRTTQRLFVERCGTFQFPGFVLERQTGATWLTEYGTICPSVRDAPLLVEPNATRAYEESVAHSPRQDVAPRFLSADPTGVYRLRIGAAFWDYDPVTDSRQRFLKPELMYSAPFHIVLR